MRIVRSNIIVKCKVRSLKSSVEMTVNSARFLYKIISDAIMQADIKRMANCSFLLLERLPQSQKKVG